MRKYLAALAVLSIAAVAAAAPTYQYSSANLGGGLFGYTFYCDNTGELESAWFVEMEWSATTINQILAFGTIQVDEEAMATTYAPLDPGYSKAEDTWIMDEFADAIMVTTDTPGYYRRESGTAAGLKYVTVDHAYIVATPDLSWTGRLGVVVGAGTVWTDVSGVIPEPATLLLLGLGGLGAIIRRRR